MTTAINTQPAVQVSVGELVDKITILEIKSERLKDADALKNVRTELDYLNGALDRLAIDALPVHEEFNAVRAGLKDINLSLWDTEDAIRAKESQKAFDAEFIEIARSVYFKNDRRAALKRKINDLVGSELVEEKSYEDYA